tara:strand:+ start:665 stop:787 length:123 start_codon:yes stop_codon:yes gene_type:complete
MTRKEELLQQILYLKINHPYNPAIPKLQQELDEQESKEDQ